MPKASKVGKFRAAARATSRDVTGAPLTAQYLAQKKKDAVTKTEDAADDENGALSRGQRKKLAKRERYLKREKMIMSSLRLKRLEEQKGRLDGLDAIREALGEASTAAASPTECVIAAAKEAIAKKSADISSTKNAACTTNKSKKALANVEISHMGLVMQHPSFKEDPFAAIQAHLRNSLAPEVERMERESQKRQEEDTIANTKKKEERKERQRDAKYEKCTRKGKKSDFKSGRARR